MEGGALQNPSVAKSSSGGKVKLRHLPGSTWGDEETARALPGGFHVSRSQTEGRGVHGKGCRNGHKQGAAEKSMAVEGGWTEMARFIRKEETQVYGNQWKPGRGEEGVTGG